MSRWERLLASVMEGCRRVFWRTSYVADQGSVVRIVGGIINRAAFEVYWRLFLWMHGTARRGS